jgi:hypothetical protein
MKDMKSILLFSAICLLAAGLFLISCGSDDELPVEFPPSDEIRVSYISSAQAPVIDGSADAVWENAQLSQLIALEDSENNPKGRVELLEIKALSDSNNIYVYARWRDEGGKDDRYRQWLWSKAGGFDPWRKDLAREDVFNVLFEMDNNVTTDMSCARFCHEIGVNNYEFNNQEGAQIDGWYWRANQTNPIGHALDLYFEDSISADSGTYGLDPEDVTGFVVNEIPSGDEPAWWDSTYTIDTIIVSIEEDTTTDPISYDTTFRYRVDLGSYLLADDTTDYQQPIGVIIDSIYVPAFVLSTDAAGDRWDVEARAVYEPDSKYWVLELKRAMNTGNPNDIVFTIGSEIVAHFAVSVDFMQSHIGFDPVVIKF